ncbi:hypothetical protein ACVIIV_005601 [Bradyrhizobium sp. USDA 4354]
MRVGAELPAPRDLADPRPTRARICEIEEGAVQPAAADVVGRYRRPARTAGTTTPGTGRNGSRSIGRQILAGKAGLDMLTPAAGPIWLADQAGCAMVSCCRYFAWGCFSSFDRSLTPLVRAKAIRQRRAANPAATGLRSPHARRRAGRARPASSRAKPAPREASAGARRQNSLHRRAAAHAGLPIARTCRSGP